MSASTLRRMVSIKADGKYRWSEYDEIAAALYDLLQHRDNVAVEYLMDSEGDGEDLVIRHLFDCEVW